MLGAAGECAVSDQLRLGHCCTELRDVVHHESPNAAEGFTLCH